MSDAEQATQHRRKVCRHLRSKAVYVPAFQQYPGSMAPSAEEAYYWCQRTMRELGPDDRLADVDRCTAGRGCYEEL